MRVTVLGGATWNRMIHVERLPDGHSATVQPIRHHDAIGGSGAGKALNLARLGADVTLHAGLGDDEAGARVRSGLAAARVTLQETLDVGGTAEHVNVMDATGGRISLMVRNGSADLPFDKEALRTSMATADVVVVDLAPWTPRAIDLARDSGQPIWTDLHDHDAASVWHAPFIEAADIVFVSHDRLPDPRAFLASLTDRGKHLAVCTRGRDGAIALDAEGGWHEVSAVPDVDVVDSNGAGDAFFAGTLFGVIEGAPIDRALRYGAEAAALAVASSELASAELTADRMRAS